MQLKLYNSLTRKKEIFKPIKKSQVTLYTCGPTVYNYAHIGNLRTYIFEDILKRTLVFNNYKVKHVMNITDVGHLTSDADTGEDKIEAMAKKQKKDAYQISEFYTKAFKKDLSELNIIKPCIYCKATDHIKEQINSIKQLEKKGFTYKIEDGIYFDTSKLKDYGKLAQLKKQKLKAGARIKLGEKKNKTDFALWKFSTKKQKRQMEWQSPWGIGFPGWHIECSAMATKYLGDNFDIHCGGIDAIPIHHTNEIAQAEAITDKKWVNYWLHSEFILSETGKMSKSKGEFTTLAKLKQDGYTSLAFRYFCLNSHYKKTTTYSLKALDSAQSAIDKLKTKIISYKTEKPTEKPTEKGKKIEKELALKFHQKINNNLNTPEALATLWETLTNKTLTNKQKLKLALHFDKILGLNLKILKTQKISKKIIDLAKQRQKARENKDWKNSDILRKKIEKEGYSVQDNKTTYELKKK